MRAIAAIMTLLALGAAGFAGQNLRAILAAPVASTPRFEVAALDPARTQSAQPAPPTRLWPAVFGTLAPPAPAPSPPEPQPPAPPEPPKPPPPPLESLGYQLKGVIRAGNTVWGIVSHPLGEKIVRVGEALEPGIVITRIDEEGLWVDNGGDELAKLGFVKDQ